MGLRERGGIGGGGRGGGGRSALRVETTGKEGQRMRQTCFGFDIVSVHHHRLLWQLLCLP